MEPTEKVRFRTIKEPNFHLLTIGKLDLYISYETIIAFNNNGNLVISENDWGKTTGKHLNYIHENHKIRIPYNDFLIKLQEAFIDIGLYKQEVSENLE